MPGAHARGDRGLGAGQKLSGQEECDVVPGAVPGGAIQGRGEDVSGDAGTPDPEPVQEPVPSQVEALLALCEQHFVANRLTTGVGGTAVECYLEVLARDPSNLEAVAGLQRVFEKYEAWARRALQKGDLAKARGYVDKLRGLVPEAPAVRELDEAIARLERQRADEARIAAEKEAKRRAEEIEERETLAARKRFQDCDGGPQMVVVPSGEYVMGTEGDEYPSDYNERPAHLVTIARPFAVGVFEVTAAEWDACVSGGVCEWNSPWGRGGGGDGPAIHVSWEDAQGYVWWLSRETGKDYRLLSESEWEYVARAGTTTAYHFGSYIYRNQANSVSIGETRNRSARIRRTNSGCTTCTGTCGSGWRIAGTTTTGGRRRMGVRGGNWIAVGECCVAARGSSVRRSCVPRTATRETLRSGTTPSVSESPEIARPGIRRAIVEPSPPAAASSRRSVAVQAVQEAGEFPWV